MSEVFKSYVDILSQLGNHCVVKEIADQRILILGHLSESCEEMIKMMSKYKRKGSDCFEATEKEIASGRANGCFVNLNLPRHVLPSVRKGELFVGYDNPLGRFDCVIFAGDETQVRKSIGDFFSIDYPYGKDFVFQNNLDG